jgi:hypothetical protein
MAEGSTFSVSNWYSEWVTTSVDFRSRALEYDFGQDPMMVFGVPFKIRNLLFQDFGQYEVRLFCDDRIIGRDYIEFRGK